MPLNIMGFAAIYKMGFTPKMLGLGNVSVRDKLALLQARDLCCVTCALIPTLPLVSPFVRCSVAATQTDVPKAPDAQHLPPLPQPQNGGSFNSPSRSPRSQR